MVQQQAAHFFFAFELLNITFTYSTKEEIVFQKQNILFAINDLKSDTKVNCRRAAQLFYVFRSNYVQEWLARFPKGITALFKKIDQEGRQYSCLMHYQYG